MFSKPPGMLVHVKFDGVGTAATSGTAGSVALALQYAHDDDDTPNASTAARTAATPARRNFFAR
ncbi:hypothetical protein ACSU1L_00705 [Microbacterium sp. A94]